MMVAGSFCCSWLLPCKTSSSRYRSDQFNLARQSEKLVGNQHQEYQLQLAEFLLKQPGDQPSTGSMTLFPLWETDFVRHIKRLHKHFVVTGADKMPNNYVPCCMKFYVQRVLLDLSSAYFARVLAEGDLTVAQTIARKLLEAVKQLAPDAFDLQSVRAANREAWLLSRLEILPYASALVKLHKQPLQLRFLACSGQNGLKPIAVGLTALFRAVHIDLVGAWKALLKRAERHGLTWADEDPWYITRSAQIVGMLRLFNETRMSAEDFITGSGWQGFDFARLYTNIPQDDLKAKLKWVMMHCVWRRHGWNSRVIQVWKNKHQAAQWCDPALNMDAVVDALRDAREVGIYDRENDHKHGMKTNRLGVHEKLGEFYLFDYTTACGMIDLLVSHAYVTFADRAYHQIQGMPMGTNPAVSWRIITYLHMSTSLLNS